ncbi:MAG: hypothetical protein PHQ52_06810 [Candidatus Omnitrophica bacterium]|nr:hypothetical protein [Candidatus Omnitrophota bacterium]
MLSKAKECIEKYLKTQLDSKQITQEIFDKANAVCYTNLKTWATDPSIHKISPNTSKGIESAVNRAINTGNWKNVIEAFRQDISFGTAGIRGKCVLCKNDFDMFFEQGISAPILKGPNTINDIVLLLKTAGVINVAKKRSWTKIAIGYDSRVNGKQFAQLIAQSFIGNCDHNNIFKVFLFDEASPFPELSFAVTTKQVRADIGILVSASHNPCDYNGYKITDNTGKQLTGDLRNEIVDAIEKVSFSDITIKPLEKAIQGQVVWLGGKTPIEGKDYKGVDVSVPDNFIDMHTLYIEQLKKFIIDKKMSETFFPKLRIGFSAFNGAGNKAVPRILKELGFLEVKVVSELQKLDGRFPAFGWGEQPDPGDPISADIAVKEFIKEYGQQSFDELDMLIGTDPDADRLGVIIKVPSSQQKYFGKYKLLSANDAWTLLIWYRLYAEKKLNNERIENVEKKYITFSHVTTDALEKVASFFGVSSLGEMMDSKNKAAGDYLNGKRSWVGFSYIGAFANKMREQGFMNIAGAEESNGFSILGGPVKKGEILGEKGHVNDKDGTFAAVLLAEAAAYARSKNSFVFEILDDIYKQIGFYATANKPMPRIGSFEGADGITKKINLLKIAQQWKEKANNSDLKIANKKVIGAVEFKTGRYDKFHYEGFPDEGIRFFFEDTTLSKSDDFKKSNNFITIRPSGTSQTIRFYTQLEENVSAANELGEIKKKALIEAEKIALLAQKQLLLEASYIADINSVEEQIKKIF